MNVAKVASRIRPVIGREFLAKWKIALALAIVAVPPALGQTPSPRVLPNVSDG